GRPDVGDGFGIPLILRYILETCHDCATAREALTRIPTHMAYNVTVLDAGGKYLTAHLAPDRPTTFSDTPATTNHQNGIEWDRYAQAVSTVERRDFLLDHVNDEGAAQFTARFLEPPLFSTQYERSFGTL